MILTDWENVTLRLFEWTVRVVYDIEIGDELVEGNKVD